jgi:YVTN family beta-propeller protein
LTEFKKGQVMQSKSSKRSHASWARGLAALSVALVLVLALGARVAEASPFAYVANATDNTVSVIDTASNILATTITVGVQPTGIAVTPDGAPAYVANRGSNSVSVITTATNQVTGTVQVGLQPIGVAVTPDGSRYYVTDKGSNTVSVIATPPT